MSKFYNTSVDKVPNSGGSVQLIIGTTGSTTNQAFQTASTPCKKVWILANAETVRVNIGSACTGTTVGLPVPPLAATAGQFWYAPLILEIDDINKLYFYGSGGTERIDILWRE